MEHRDAELCFLDGLEDKSDRLDPVGKHEDPRRVAALSCAVVDLLEVLQELPRLLVLSANLYHLEGEATQTQTHTRFRTRHKSNQYASMTTALMFRVPY